VTAQSNQDPEKRSTSKAADKPALSEGEGSVRPTLAHILPNH
jgi:hypothetical protein